MPESEWLIEGIHKRHVRDKFDCGVPELDEFIRRYARQNEEMGLGRTFVATRRGDPTPQVFGYFTLSAGFIEREDLPEEARQRLPRYPVPVIHLGKLGVDRSVQGQRLGEVLLVSALQKAFTASKDIGSLAVEVIAINEAAKGFYEKYGFQGLLDDRLHLYLPMKTIAKLFGG